MLSGLFVLPLLFPSLNAQQTQVQSGAPRDGGVSQTLQSIYIPALVKAPFTATVHTEWIRTLPDGGTFTLVNQRRIARDSQGRIYEERWFLVPKNGKAVSQNNVIQIADPNARTLYNCFLLIEPHHCNLLKFAERPMTTYKPSAGRAGPLPNGNGFSTHEELGVKTIEGIDTIGTRDSDTVNEGVIGNDRPFVVKREFWYAASLGINLRSEITDPSFGTQTFTVTDISTSEPEPQLFELPSGFEVVDQRQPKSAPSE